MIPQTEQCLKSQLQSYCHRSEPKQRCKQIQDVRAHLLKSLSNQFRNTSEQHAETMQDATHGNSLSHRAPGSIGQNQSPGKVFKGKKMAGRMGNVNRTAQNLEVIGIDKEKNMLMVKGAIPGSVSGTVIVRPAIKYRNEK